MKFNFSFFFVFQILVIEEYAEIEVCVIRVNLKKMT